MARYARAFAPYRTTACVPANSAFLDQHCFYWPLRTHCLYARALYRICAARTLHTFPRHAALAYRLTTRIAPELTGYHRYTTNLRL